MMFQRYEVLMATPALSHWDVKVGGTSMEEMRGAGFAGSAPPFRGQHLHERCNSSTLRAAATVRLHTRRGQLV